MPRSGFRTMLVTALLVIAGRPGLAAAPPLFEEAVGTGLDFVHVNGMTGSFYMPEINSGGGGLVDYDRDGDLDLYLVQGHALGAEKLDPADRDRLYRNDLVVHGDGRREIVFVDVTESSGIVATGYGMGVAAGDYDGDGWPDLYVTNLGPNQLWRNNGDGTFRDVTAASGADDPRWSVAASWADYDRDGRLDLFVGNYVDFTFANHKVCRTATGAQDYCGPTAFPSLPDRLFRNRGDGTFEDVTVAAGIADVLNKTLGVVAADFNGDGRLDYYVASDRTPNQLWIQGADGRFTDEALLAGCAVNSHGKAEASMGVDAADVDGDGDLDLFMTHLVRETNTLFLNDGTGLFEDATIQTGLGPPSWPFTSWGTAWFDYDSDGWLEMMVANGDVRVIEDLANAGDPFPFHQPNQLFHALGGGRFEEVTGEAGEVFELSEVSRAVSVGDLDNDGDPDLLLVNNNGPARVLLNRVDNAGRWLGVAVDAMGAQAVLTRVDGLDLWRRVRTDGSFATTNDPRMLFGLAATGAPERLRVLWPGGEVAEWRLLPVGRYLRLTPRPGDLPP